MADEVENEAPETKTYYLRPGVTHNAGILKGEYVRYEKAGDKVELTEEQFGNFRDKFFTDTEFKAYREEQEEAAKAAQEAPDTQTSGEHMNREQIGTQNQAAAADAASEKKVADQETANKEPTDQVAQTATGPAPDKPAPAPVKK